MLHPQFNPCHGNCESLSPPSKKLTFLCFTKVKGIGDKDIAQAGFH